MALISCGAVQFFNQKGDTRERNELTQRTVSEFQTIFLTVQGMLAPL
jgi:hypothetical protein